MRWVFVGIVVAATVAGEVLHSRNDMLVINRRPGTLKRLDGGHTDARHQVRVFPVSLFRAAPTWVAVHIQQGGIEMMSAARPRLRCGDTEDIMHQVQIPSAG